MKLYKPNSLMVMIAMPVLFTLLLLVVSPLFSALPFPKLWFGIMGCICSYVVIHVGKKLDKYPLNGFNLTIRKMELIHFLKGLLMGVIIAGAMIGSQVLYSDLALTFQPENTTPFLLGIIAVFPCALMEELAFRSYAFFRMEQVLGVWKAQVLMAILFALYHVAGGWSVSSAFIGPGIWSLAFGLLALQTKGIAKPTGFHMALNLVLAMIGDKDYVPGLWTVDFPQEPTEAMIQSNTNFGLTLHGISLIVLIFITWKYTRKND